MDEDTPSKRLTRGSLAKLNAYSDGKSNEELRSKHRNDPITLQQSISKSNNKGEECKSVGGEIEDGGSGSKKRRKVNKIDSSSNVAMSTDNAPSEELQQNISDEIQVVRLKVKQRTKNSIHMQCYTNIDIMIDFDKYLTEPQKSRFCCTICFAQLTTMNRCHEQAQFFRSFMFRELEGSPKDAFLIYVNGTSLRFTRRKFSLVYDLKCDDDLSDFVFNKDEPNRILEEYFEDRDPFLKQKLVDSFTNKVWGDNNDDALKFAILYFIHTFIHSTEPGSVTIDRL